MAYNGWVNWETWSTSLYFEFAEDDALCEQMYHATIPERASILRDYVTEAIEMEGCNAVGLAAEFILSGLGKVDFYELARDCFDEDLLEECFGDDEDEEED